MARQHIDMTPDDGSIGDTIQSLSDKTDANFGELYDRTQGLSVSNNTLLLNGVVIGSDGPDTVSGTTYTLVAADQNKRKVFTSASAVTITVPSGLPAGFSVTLEQSGAGQLSISASGTTIHNVSGFTKSLAQYAVMALLYDSADTYTLTGSVGP